MSVSVSVVTLVLALFPIVTLGLFLSSYFAQRQLSHVVKIQSSAISELIKTKESGKELAAALTQATNVNNELKDLITTLRTVSSSIPSNTLGVSSVSADTAPSATADQTSVGGVELSASASSSGSVIGMVQVNGEPSEIKDIYGNPQLGAAVAGSAAGSDFLFYIQKQPGWYQVQLNSGTTGWIQEDVVTSLME